MDRSGAPGKKWILWLGLLLAGAALGITALLLLGGSGLSARYDVAEDVTALYDPSAGAATTMEDDGSLTVRLTREDIYWYASRYGILDEVQEKLASSGATAMGFRLADSRLRVFARCRTLGLLPLSYRAECSVTWDGEALVITPERVRLGQRIRLSRSRWPALFDTPLRLSLTEATSSVTDARLQGDALVLSLEGLRTRSFGQLTADRSLLKAMEVFSPPEVNEDVVSWLTSLRDDQIPMDAARALCLFSDDATAACTELLACSESASVPSVWEAMDDFVRRIWGRSLSELTARRREALDTYLSAEQSKYEKLLSAVREMYKSGSLAIGETGFFAAGKALDPGAMTSLSATATDCRVVFLCSADPAALGAEAMPCVDDVPRASKGAMEGLLTPGAAYDLGVVLTSEGGVPVLLHTRQDGGFVIRCISEKLYVSILVERAIPVLDMESLPAPGRELARPSGEGWNGACILTLPETNAE